MTQEAFLQLTLLLRKHWSRQTGILMRLQRAEEDSAPLLFCVGRLDNTAFRAEFCKLCEGDKLLFDGPINHPELLGILQSKGVCFGELNTAAKLDVKAGPYYCFGNPTTCQKQCILRKQQDAEPSVIQCTGETIRTSEASE